MIKAVILNENNEIIGLLKENVGTRAEVAWAVTKDGEPVNRCRYKVSASKRNIERGRKSDAPFATRQEYGSITFYTV